MDKKERFMEAVAAKVGKRKPMMKRKGGPSVIIAIGAPKPGPMMGKDKAEDMDGEDMPEETMGKMGKAEKIAMLQEKIAGLKAELALLEDEDEMDEPEMDDDEAEDEEA
jgi:hypothetical protein